MKLLLIGSPDCPSGLPAAPFFFQPPFARWPRFITTRTLLRSPLWTEEFMHDFAASATHDNDIITIFFEVTSLTNTVHLPMYKLATKSTHLQDIWRTQGFPLQTETQVLGMDWETQSDTIHLDHTDFSRALPERPATKRQVLQVTSRFYDPLELFSPVALVRKFIFQNTWKRTRVG